jgi:hypothetical protein
MGNAIPEPGMRKMYAFSSVDELLLGSRNVRRALGRSGLESTPSGQSESNQRSGKREKKSARIGRCEARPSQWLTS